MELAQIELHFFAPDELVDIDAVQRHHEGQAVRLGYIEHMIGGYHGSGAGHVLGDEIRLTGDIFAHVSSKDSGPAVVKSTRCRAHHNANGFAFVEGLGLCPAPRGEPGSEKRNRKIDQGKRKPLPLHDNLHSLL
jgi:hypothetical protein